MKILVSDRDRLTCQLIRTKLEPAGHEIIEQSVKNEALEQLGQENFDAVFFDPAPLTNARPIVIGIRRSVTSYPYIVMMSHNPPEEGASKNGMNDVISKPLDPEDLETKVQNAERLTNLVKRIADEKEDFPSAGGVISKSAFNQLFLSAIDRSDRYGEESHIVFISIENYEEIKSTDGPYAAEYAVSKLAQHLVRLRRQSDIIAQTGNNEYALLLQGAQTPTEPVEAANRFALALNDIEDIVSSGSSPVQINVSLIDVPKGYLHIERKISREAVVNQESG